MREIQNRLEELFRRRSLLFGEFRLASGLVSPYYFDAKRTTLDPEGAYLAARLVLETIRREEVAAEAIGGLTLGADPVVASTAALSYALRDRYRPLSGFIVRKSPKGHGTRRFIEGYSGPPGAPVIVLDDVCTTGASTLTAIERVEAAGYRVSAVMALLDREQGGARKLSAYRFLPLLSGTALLDHPEVQRQLAAPGG